MTKDDSSPKKSQNVKTQDKSGKEIHEQIKESGSKHSYADEEKVCFVWVINETLKDDEFCKQLGLLPINVENEDLFEACNNGIVFCKLVNKI